MDILAYHGWGFDRHCWQGWVTAMQQHGHTLRCFDQGYGSQPQTPTVQAMSTPRVVVVHSFGLHLCPLSVLEQADRVVIFGSFLAFHPADSKLTRRSQRRVQRMSDRFRSHPLEVLQAFWQNCDAPKESWPEVPAEQLNLALLQQDLDRLNATAVDADAPLVKVLSQVPSVTVVHGDADQIVPVSQGATLADAVSAALITVPNAGHALPFSHPTRCWALEPFTSP